MSLLDLCDEKPDNANVDFVDDVRYGAVRGSVTSRVKRGLRRLAISAINEIGKTGRCAICNVGEGNNAGVSDAILLDKMNMPNNSNSIECFIVPVERVLT